MSVIECCGLSVCRHHTRVLDNVTFTVAAGELVVVAGANGAGKTTLLHTLLGFLRVSCGSARIYGNPPGLRAVDPHQAMGYMPQHTSTASALPIRVRDLVAIGRCGYARPWRGLSPSDHEAIMLAMEAVSITHLADRPLDAISGGERQRAGIARVLAQDAGLWLLDEPVVGLDLGARMEVLDLIETLCATRGLTVLLVMHELAVLPSSCRRALVLDRGRLALDGDPAELFSMACLAMIYGHNAGRVATSIRGERAC